MGRWSQATKNLLRQDRASSSAPTPRRRGSRITAHWDALGCSMAIWPTPITANFRCRKWRLAPSVRPATTKVPAGPFYANTSDVLTTFLPLIASASWPSILRSALVALPAEFLSGRSAPSGWNGTPLRLVSNNFLAASDGQIGEQDE